jgi:hypothetical protein
MASRLPGQRPDAGVEQSPRNPNLCLSSSTGGLAAGDARPPPITAALMLLRQDPPSPLSTPHVEIDRRLFYRSTVGSFADQPVDSFADGPSALLPINRQPEVAAAWVATACCRPVGWWQRRPEEAAAR